MIKLVGHINEVESHQKLIVKNKILIVENEKRSLCTAFTTPHRTHLINPLS